MYNINWLKPPEQALNIEVDAKTIIKACEGKGLYEVPQHSLLNSCQRKPPNPPIQHKLSDEQLLPCAPTVRLSDKNEAFNPWIREFCLRQPIVLIKNLAKFLDFNLNLFTSETLIKANAKGIIEERSQTAQNSEENWDEEYKQKVWKYSSVRQYSTIEDYALYQNKMKKNQKVKKKKKTANNENNDNFDQSNSDLEEDQTMIEKGEIRFGTNVDLSNMKKWGPQWTELKKLPPFFQIDSDENMLNYVGFNILGMNTIQLYMKVPGCRTPGHQEDNNFCSVNISIGPGVCKWFAVPYEYWGALCLLCERHGLDYLNGSWWPDLDELYKNNIPVYKFCQKRGDLIWLNTGCVYWVQANGVSNNIAWNVGPFTAKQYQAAIERYEWNKLRRFQSIVPMVHLSWNLACKVRMSDVQLYRMIKNCLFLTLRQYCLTLEFVENKNVKVESYECNPSYCNKCMIELFGILFISQQNKKLNKYIPYCLDCALKVSPLLKGFTCIKVKDLQNLTNIYDNFILNELPTAAFTDSTLDWQNVEDGLNINADARTIIEICESRLNSVLKRSLLKVRSLPKPLLQKQLFLSVHSISLNDKREAWEFESWLESYCWNHPVALLHDLTTTVDFNKKLFWTKYIRKTSRKLKLEKRTQIQQSNLENWSKTPSKKDWKCYSRRSYTTIKEYHKYQIMMAGKTEKTYEDRQNHMENCEDTQDIKKIHLGTNADIWGFGKKCKLQLEELKKLPSFLQVDSKNNMLSYIDHKILGVNTIQFYLMVSGCRITGRQENNNFCKVSINIGPGDCDWFVVSYEYWEIIYALCECDDIDYIHDNWWPPSLKELYDFNIPVCRFRQHKGDLVWLNAGCIYWMQADNVCNNIMWNVGPFRARQYELALERYEWNKLHSFQSIVPMINLSWNLACETTTSDPQLYRFIKTCMLLTLRRCYLLLKYIKNENVKVESYNNEAIAHYCKNCLIELFSIVLIQDQKKIPVSYCLDCALQCFSSLKGFICLEKHSIQKLMNIYDNFTLDLC